MNTPISLDSIVSAAPQQLSCDLADESAILNLKNTVYYGLDPVGTRIWHMLQQPTRVSKLRDRLLAEYDVEAEQCERDVLGLLEAMRDEGLIQVDVPGSG